MSKNKFNNGIKKAEENTAKGNNFKTVLAMISLVFFNLVFVLGPFLGVVGVMIGLFASGVALTLSGILLFIAVLVKALLPEFFNISLSPLLSIILSIVITGLGILWVIGNTYLSKSLYKLTAKYLKMNKNIIDNRRNKLNVNRNINI